MLDRRGYDSPMGDHIHTDQISRNVNVEVYRCLKQNRSRLQSILQKHAPTNNSINTPETTSRVPSVY